MDMSSSLGRAELLRVAETVAQEKGISADEVLEAMEQAVQTAARRKYGMEHEIVAEIDRRSGDIRLYRELEVADPVDDYTRQIGVEDAQMRNPAAQIGDHILDPLPPIDLGRIAAQSAKQVIVQRVREAERERQYNEFKDRIGEVVVGEVKRVEHGNVLVDLGRAEAIVRRDDLIPRELFRPKDRIRAFLYDVRHETRGPQIFLSRTHPGFMEKLFEQEVPGDLRRDHRDQGLRPRSGQPRQDRGDLQGQQHRSGRRLRRHARQPRPGRGAGAGRREGRHHPVVARSGHLRRQRPGAGRGQQGGARPRRQADRGDRPATSMQHIAIGRRGQNVRLASQLTGWDIDIVSDSEDRERRQREFRELTQMFMDSLNVEEVIAQLLVTEGFTSVQDVAYTETEELAGIAGFDEEIAEALKERAVAYLEEVEQNLRAEAEELGHRRGSSRL